MAMTQVADDPELLAVCRLVLLVGVVRQPPAQPGLAHARVAHEYDLGGSVLRLRLMFRLAQERGEVQLPDVDNAIASVLVRMGIGAYRGQHRFAWVKRHAGRPVG